MLLLFAIFASAEKRQFSAAGRERYYLLHVPRNLDPQPPLLIVLHGMGGIPDQLFEAWKPLADKHRFLLVAPKSTEIGFGKRSYGVPVFQALLADVFSAATFDPARVYLFGYSNGAAHALDIGMLWSDHVAAIVSMAGSLLPSESLEARATRKIPVLLFAAEQDTIEPPTQVRRTFDALRDRSFPVEYVELRGIGHNYGSVAYDVHVRAWDFLRSHRLSAPAATK